MHNREKTMQAMESFYNTTAAADCNYREDADDDVEIQYLKLLIDFKDKQGKQTGQTGFLQDVKRSIPSVRKKLTKVRAKMEDHPTGDPNERAKIINDYWSKLWRLLLLDMSEHERKRQAELHAFFARYRKRMALRGTTPAPTIDRSNGRRHLRSGDFVSGAGPDGIRIPFAIAAYNLKAMLTIAAPLLHSQLLEMLTHCFNPGTILTWFA